jgi:hypothetical protein
VYLSLCGDYNIHLFDYVVNTFFDYFYNFFIDCSNQICYYYNVIRKERNKMAVSSKIRALLRLKNKENIALSSHLGITNQALNNKLYRGSFSAEDLIKIAAFLDCELAFILSDKQKISLDLSDLRQGESEPLPVGAAAGSEG